MEKYTLLAKNQKGRGLEALITQVLNKPHVYVFGELLSLQSVRDLQGGEFDKAFQTLQLFAYGTYQDFVAEPANYIDLSEAMRTKLRQLSIVTLAATNKIISYAVLRRELELDSVRALEDLIIETIYAGLLVGKLDQKSEVFRIKGTMGRDILPEKVDTIIEQLLIWKEQCAQLVAAVKSSSDNSVARRQASKIEQDEVQRAAAEIKSNLKDSLASGNSGDDHHDKSRGAHQSLSSTSASRNVKRTRAGGSGRLG